MYKLKITPLIIILLILSKNILIAQQSVILQSTTSTKNSGLYNFLLPILKKDTGVTVHVVAVGTGAAIKNAENCDGDILLVHDVEKEKKFIKKRFGDKRFKLMYNDFIIVGPETNPANINLNDNIITALKKISSSKSYFISRGDNSGTDAKEKYLWKLSKINTKRASGTWYLETGSGMGATLNIAIGIDGYTLVDRASWITYTNKNNFRVFVQNDNKLFNQYGLISLNKIKCPKIKYREAQMVINWLLSQKGQSLIGSYTVNGQKLFFPNFKK